MTKTHRKWHVFICHATEDKEDVARPLAEKLKDEGLAVWYDEFSLNIGDNLRRAIEEGLSKSRFGVVIVSPDFFKKEWPRKELDVMVQKETLTKRQVVLPVWHNVNEKTVAKYSPMLATVVAAKTSDGLEEITKKIMMKIGHKSSTKKKTAQAIEQKTDDSFQQAFGKVLSDIKNLLEKRNRVELDGSIDGAIMLFKNRIEKWDVSSVGFATEQLFLNLYTESEEDGFLEMYSFLKDLFHYAYSQRPKMLWTMIERIELIMMDSWVPNDLQKGEKAAKVLLRLAIDFVDKDIEVTKDCARAISNLASDFYEPEILSKQILLAAATYYKYHDSPSAEIVKELIRQIKRNNGYATDEGVMTLLKDSISHAAADSNNYGFDLAIFKEKYLDKILEESIDEQIKEYAEFLVELEEGERQDDDISFETQMLEDMIFAYESIRPQVTAEIRQAVLDLQNQEVNNTFEKMIDSSKLLTKVYRRSDMITTFDEFIEFLQVSAAYSESSIGSTVFGDAFIHFPRKLNENEKDAIGELEKKYKLRDRDLFSSDLYDDELHIMVDFLVYEDHTYYVENLVTLLKEINNIIRISRIVTGMAFTFRDSNTKDTPTNSRKQPR